VTCTNYDTLPLGEMLRMAGDHTDPFVRALARRLDATAYQLDAYRNLLGLPRTSDSRQLDLFTD